MKNFEKIKQELREKWLDYWGKNRHWIVKWCDQNKNKRWIWIEEDNVHPDSTLMLGIIANLEPDLSEYWLEPFCELNSDTDAIIRVLGLDFDPDKELEIREEKKKKELEKQQKLFLSSPLDDFRQKMKEFNNTS